MVVASRLDNPNPNQRDFLTHLVDEVHEGRMSREELTAHASTLV